MSAFTGFKTPLSFYNAPQLDDRLKGFNPWQNYNTPADYQGWNYTTDPYFNAAANKPRWDLAQTGAGTEDDRARVWRFTMDTLKQQGFTNPGAAPQEAVTRAYLDSISRLRRDYMAPENAAMGGWQNSPYYGYNQFLQNQVSAPTGGQTPPTPPTQPQGNPPTPPPAAAPPTPPPPVTPTGPVGGAPGGNAGAGAGVNGANGGPNNTLSAEWLAAHPQEALRQAFLRQGIDITRPGPLQNFIRGRFQNVMEGAIGLQGLAGKAGGQDVASQMPGLLDLFGSYLTPGANPNQALRSLGSSVMADPKVSQYLNMLDNQSDAIKFFGQAQSLATQGQNPLIQTALSNELQRQADFYLNSYGYNQAQAGKETDPFMQWWKTTPWASFFNP